MALSASDRPGWRGAITRFFQRSYLADYFGLFLLITAYAVFVRNVEPFHRLFTTTDLYISYPHALVQRVSSLQNVIYAGLFPLSFFLLWAILLRPGWHKFHVTLLGLIISLTLTTFLTNISKNAIGRPRPDLLDRCKPLESTPKDTLVDISVCTAPDNNTLQDGWRSFPSGHSSFAFSGLGYLSLWLAGQLRVFRPRTDLARVLVSLAPAIGALMIAISRLEDYRHDVWDVTAGSLLGAGVAFGSYRRYFRGLSHGECDVPYPGRAMVEKQKMMRGDVEAGRRVAAADEFELADVSGDEDESVPLNAGGRDREGGQVQLDGSR